MDGVLASEPPVPTSQPPGPLTHPRATSQAYTEIWKFQLPAFILIVCEIVSEYFEKSLKNNISNFDLIEFSQNFRDFIFSS